MGIILVVQGIKLSFWRRYYLWLISLFFNMFLPSAVGGDIAKAYYIYKDTGKKMASVTCVLLDRFFGLMSIVFIAFVAFIFARDQISDPRIGEFIWAVTLIILFGTLFVTSRRFSRPAKALIIKLAPSKFKEEFQKLFDALELYRTRRGQFFVIFGMSISAQILFILMAYWLAISIQIRLPLELYYLFMPIVALLTMIPSIGGLGVREAATVYFFQKYVSVEQAFAFSLILDVLLYGVGALCGILYAVKGGASMKDMERLEEQSLKKGVEKYES